jgi:hypothetical protein
MDEKTLKERYQRLLRDPGSGPRVVPLEQLEALAEGRLPDQERIAVLEAIYADPATRAEFEFLRELARERPRSADRRRLWLAAAAIVLVAGAGLIWRAGVPGLDPVRGSGGEVVLVAPAPGVSVLSGDTLAWRPTAGAISYVVEVVTEEGELAFRSETRDTIVPLAATRFRGPAQWYVTASLGGAATVRSAPRRITLAP